MSFKDKFLQRLIPYVAAALIIGWVVPVVVWAGTADQTGRWHFQQGIAQYNAKNYAMAGQSFKLAAQKDQSLSAEAHLYLGRSLIQQKKWMEGIKQIAKAKQLGLSRENEQVADVSLTFALLYGDVSTVPVKKQGEEAARRETPVRKTTQAPKKPWSLYLSASGEYVDGIAPPLTVATALSPPREDDFRALLGLGGQYRFNVGDKGTLVAGYDFSQTLYSEFNEFNLQTHTFSGRYSRPLNKDISLSVNYGYTHYTLDGDDFLGTHLVALSGFFHETGPFYGRVGYRFQNDEFDFNPSQDRDLHSINLIQYWFFPNTKDYLSGGYIYTNANATLSRWDFDSHRVFASGQYEPRPKHTLTVLLSYTSYNYDGFDTLETTKIRDTDIIGFRMQWTYEVLARREVFVKYSVTDVDSNIIRQDYLGQVFSLGTNITW